MNDDRTMLINLRVSIARTVQCLNLTNDQLPLPVMGKNLDELRALADKRDAGWHVLVAIVVHELLHFQAKERIQQQGLTAMAKELLDAYPSENAKVVDWDTSASFNDNEPFDDGIYPKI